MVIDWNYIVVAFIGVIGGLFIANVADGVRLLKKWGDENPKYHFAIDLAIETGCTVAEKIFSSGEGQEKLKFVVSWVTLEAKRFGVNLDEKTLVDEINKYVAEVINAGREG